MTGYRRQEISAMSQIATFQGEALMYDFSLAISPATPPSTAPYPARVGGDDATAGPVMIYNAGAEIYAEGDRLGALYRLVYGVVRVYRLLADGRRQICAFHRAGEIFGFEAGAERHFFADAVNPVGLRVLRPGGEVETSRGLLNLALNSLERAHDHLLTVGRNDAMGRVAAFLLEMGADRDGEALREIDLPMSRADIGDYLGLTIETVSRVLTRLKSARVIRLASTRHLEILRRDVLEDMTA
jgi:CRP/FNR family nitrogen fixation transcriptional regulator